MLTSVKLKVGFTPPSLKIIKYIAAIASIIAICLIYFRFPVLVTFTALTALLIIAGDTITATHITVLLTVALFAWINSGKYLAGDLTWYYDHFILLNKIPLTSYLGSNVNQFTIKSSEPFYYTASFILSRLSNGNTLVLNIFITTWVYLLTGLSFSKMVNCVELSRARAMTAVLAAMLTGVTFSLTTHLVRQEFAAAALLCCAVSLFFKKTKSMLVFGLISATCHESAYIPLTCLFTGYMCHNLGTSSEKLKKFLTITFPFLFLAAGLYYSNHIVFDSPYQKIRSDGSISPAIILLDAVLYVITAFHINNSKSKSAKAVVFIGALYFSFLIGVSESPLPFLRMYFYIDLLRGCEVAYISVLLLRSSHGLLFIIPIIFTSVLYTELRILSSGFNYYGGGIIGHLLFPIFFI